MWIDLKQLRDMAEQRPAGYVDTVLKAGQLREAEGRLPQRVEIELETWKRLRKEFAGTSSQAVVLGCC